MFPSLPGLPGFLPSGSGGSNLPGGGISLPGGITIGSGPIFGGSGQPSGSGATKIPVATSASALSTAGNFLSCVMSPGTCLLRLVLLIIGLICIIGAIYLYKPTQEIVAAPVRAAKEGLKGVAEGVAVSGG